MLSIFLSILSACSSKKESFREECREKINAFFLELLIDHGGIYTLLGSKPVTIESLLTLEEYEESRQYVEANPEILTFLIDRRLEEGWEEWKKMPKHLSSHYILTEVPLNRGRDLVFMNVQKTIEILHENYAVFKQIIGKDFDPSKKVHELREGKNDFWASILSNRTSLGILLGYGNKNAHLFEKYMHSGTLDAFEPSDKIDPRSFGGSSDLLQDPKFKAAEYYLEGRPLYLPIFVMADSAESRVLVDRYRKEREHIGRRYKGKNFLNTTLSQLGCKF